MAGKKIESQRMRDALLKLMEQFKSGALEHNWDSGRAIVQLAMQGGRNAEKKFYLGWNAFITGVYIKVYGYDSDIFMTFNAIKKAGGMVNKGAKAVDIIKVITRYYDLRGEKKEIKYAEYKKLKAINPAWVDTGWGGIRTYTVFNLSQTNLPYEKIQPQEINTTVCKIAEAEDIIEGYKDKPRFVPTKGTPCYVPSEDIIKCPDMALFRTGEFFYGTLFHEMIHSTGHESRLKRDIKNRFGSSDYAFEEMVAEIGSSVLMGLAGIADEGHIKNNADYIEGWERAIKDDEDFIDHFYHAFNKAMKAVDYIMGNTEAERKELLEAV